MKCETIQELLSRYLTNELSADQHALVKDHVNDCAECREALAFHRSLESRMDAAAAEPASLQGRVSSKIAAAKSPSWLTRVFGDPTMKKIFISSTAITAVLAMAFLMTPRSAHASNAADKFKAMKAAIQLAVHNGELAIDISSDKDGTLHVTGTLDGSPLPEDFPLDIQSTRDGNEIDIEITADFSPSNYSKIEFGKDQNTLVLYPKGNPKTKAEVVLDPKTNKPKSWKNQTWTWVKGDQWEWTSNTGADLQLKKTANPGATVQLNESNLRPKVVSDTVIHAHVKMYVGSNASIRVTG